MAIETSIYGLLKPQEAPSYLDSAQKAATLGSTMQSQARGAQEMDAEKMQAHLRKASAWGEAMSGLAGMPEQQRAAAYPKVYAQMAQAGIVSPDQAPADYDPGYFRSTVMRYQQTAPAIKAALEKSQIKLHESQAAENYAQAKAAGSKVNPAKQMYDQLAPENQKQIETLAGKNATKTSIKNQIDSALEILSDPKVNETQKVTIGQQLLKTLNSTEGADAVGAEESRRLGSLLEKKMFNFTQAGSMFGRDIPEFVDQVKLTSGSIGQAVERNKAEIDKLYGRQGAGVNPIQVPVTAQKAKSGIFNEAKAAAPKRAVQTPQDVEAIHWAQRNKSDPRAQQILKMHGVTE